MADVLRFALPFAVFAAFLGFFRLRARSDGMSTDDWLRARNRRTFEQAAKPGWMVVWVVFAAAAWTVLFVMSGFKPGLLAALPVIVLWVPLGTLAMRWWYRRTG